MKVKIIAAIILLSILAPIQTIAERNITIKKPVQAATIVSSSLIYGSFDKKISHTEVLNNESLSPEKAINAGNIAEINYSNSISVKTHSQTEVYNIKRLDDFMKNINNGKKDSIKIVKYENDNKHTWVNKLEVLNYDGKLIKSIAYDTYSNPEAFIPSKPTYSDRIIKRDYPHDLWYGSCLAGSNGKNCYTLISLKKNDIIPSSHSIKPDGKTDNAAINMGKSAKFSRKEISDAINCVKEKFKDFEGCNLTKLWYDEEKSNTAIDGYLTHGHGFVNGVKAENVIILLSEFNVDSSGGDRSFEPNSTYGNWKWILIRDSKTSNWRVDGWGY